MTYANRIIGLLIATSTSVITTSLRAERYMVKLRSPSTFKQEVDVLRKSIVNGKWLRPRASIFGDRVRYVDAISNGNLIIVDTQDKAAIKSMSLDPRIEYVEQERWFKIPKFRLSSSSQTSAAATQNGTEEITWGLKAVGATDAWTLASDGVRGAGVRIAVIDSGIDRSHIDLIDRLEKGEDFLSRPPSQFPDDGDQEQDSFFTKLLRTSLDDVFAQEPDDSIPYPYFDQIGHGTHVAGTIAASQNGIGVVGVAPESRILAGRVCGSLGCSSVGIVRAIDWAITEKVDLINMSLGGPFPSRAQLEASERAEAAGITIVAASGNDGADHLGFPAGYPTVISVGAVTPNLIRAEFSQHGEGLTVMGPGTEVNSSVPAGTGRSGNVFVSINGVDQEVAASSFLGATPTIGLFGAELVFAKLGSTADFAELTKEQLQGKIALIQRGTITFGEKVENAIAAGAAGVIIYNNEAGLMSGAISEDGADIGIPVLMIEQTIGEMLAAKLVVGETQTARVQVNATDFSSFQGTSMASPHVAGVVALMKAANKALTPDQIRSILKFTAQKKDHMNEFEYGAGVANAATALQFIESTRQFNWDNHHAKAPEIPALASK